VDVELRARVAGDLASQHRAPVGQAAADLAAPGARDLLAADPRGRVQLNARSQRARCAWRSLSAPEFLVEP